MIRSSMLLVLAATLLTGCNIPSYINVPGDGGDAAINDPNQLTVLAIEREAIAYMLTENPLPGDVVVRFPEGTSQAAQYRVASELAAYDVYPEGVTPTDEYSLVVIREVAARGGLARVDIIRPATLREREMVEVHLTYDVWDGWSPDYIRVRNIDVDRIDPLLLTAPEAQPGEPGFEEVEPAPVEEDAAPEEAAEEDAAE